MWHFINQLGQWTFDMITAFFGTAIVPRRVNRISNHRNGGRGLNSVSNKMRK